MPVPVILREEFVAAIEAGIIECPALTADERARLRDYAQNHAGRFAVGSFAAPGCQCPLAATGIYRERSQEGALPMPMFDFTRGFDRAMDRIAGVVDSAEVY